MKAIISTAIVLATIFSSNAFASNLTYLTCNVPGTDGSADRVFNFTLDEANSTVTFYVKDANATNVEKAVFGPETITWGSNTAYTTLTRVINRVDLTFTEDTDIAGIKKHNTGTCVVKTPKARRI